jgi:propionyl-CoA carboxylase alpha chain
VQYEVEVHGRVRQVAVHRAGDGFDVTLDGRTWRVNAAHIDSRTLSLVIEPGAASYEVGFAADAATGLLDVRVGATHVPVTPNTRRRRRDEAGHAGAGPQRIIAPMPGKIVRVGVTSGEAVRARQTLVVIEAMKMENELKAGRDGTVAELHAREGASVDAGALLVVIQ